MRSVLVRVGCAVLPCEIVQALLKVGQILVVLRTPVAEPVADIFEEPPQVVVAGDELIQRLTLAPQEFQQLGGLLARDPLVHILLGCDGFDGLRQIARLVSVCAEPLFDLLVSTFGVVPIDVGPGQHECPDGGDSVAFGMAFGTATIFCVVVANAQVGGRFTPLAGARRGGQAASGRHISVGGV